MRSIKNVHIGIKVNKEFKEKLDQAIDKLPDMDQSKYVRRALENQIEKDLNESTRLDKQRKIS